MKKNIKKAVEKLGFSGKLTFTVSELEKIAAEAKVQVLDVMWYLRYER